MKRFKFFKALREHNRTTNLAETPLMHLKIRRSHMFTDTLTIFSHFGRKDLIKKTKIEFNGEDGIDSGGLTKDWYLSLSRSLSVASHNIFAETGSSTLEISQKSNASPTSLQKFKVSCSKSRNDEL